MIIQIIQKTINSTVSYLIHKFLRLRSQLQAHVAQFFLCFAMQPQTEQSYQNSLLHHNSALMGVVVRVGLVTRRLKGLSLGSGRNWWWRGVNNCHSLPPSIPRVRWDPWARHRTPNCSPASQQNLAAHCSRCVFTNVCVHLDGLNVEHKFPVWVTTFGHTSLLFQRFYIPKG